MVLGVFVTSCSKDDAVQTVVEPPIDPSSILVKSIIAKDANNAIVQSNIFTYEGKKLSKITDNSDLIAEFFYSENGNGSKIIKQQIKYPNNVFLQIIDYTYLANGKVDEITQTIYQSGYSDRYRFKFNYSTVVNGYVSYSSFYATTVGGVFGSETISKNGKIYFNGENVSKVEITDNGNSQFNKTFELTYDTKNSPFKNVIGYETISDYDYIFLFQRKLSSKTNNVKSFSKPSYNSSGVITNTFIDSYSYDFNQYNFPKTASIAKDNLAPNTSVISTTINTVQYNY
jgi:hypothetical protein